MTFPEGPGQVTLSGGRIETRLIRPAKSPDVDTLVVLLHEGLGSVSMWKDFPDHLAEKVGLPVLAYSRFGYGNSDACALPRPVSYMHDEASGPLVELLAESEAENIILIGHSDGASIAAIHAGGFADARLRALVLMAPHFYNEDLATTAIQRAKIAYDQGDLRARLQKYHGDNVDIAFRGWNDAWLNPAFHHWDIREFLPTVAVPALLIQGVEDEYGSREQLQTMQDKSGAAVRSVMLEACRHSPHRDQPEKTLNAIRQFLDDIDLLPDLAPSTC